jgi:hypothetical protein
VATFHHLLGHIRETVWEYGDVKMSKTSLEQVDTFRVKGSRLHETPKYRSALEIIVTHEVEAFAYDDLFNLLIQDKWRRFASRMYFRQSFLPYMLLLVGFSVMLNLICGDRQHVWLQQLEGKKPFDNDAQFRIENWWKDSSVVGIIIGLFGTLFAAPLLIVKGWGSRRLGPKDYDPNEDGEISGEELMLFLYKNLKFLCSISISVLCFVAVICRAGGDLFWQRTELAVWGMCAIIIWCNLLNIIMPFKFFGVLVIIIYKMLIGDFFKFAVIYMIMIFGFSQAMFCLFQMSSFPDDMQAMDVFPGNTAMRLVSMSLGDVDQQTLVNKTASPNLTVWFYLSWVMLSTVLLINLLIAMMGQTFDADFEQTHKTWIFPFARLVLSYEESLSPAFKSIYRTGEPGTTDLMGQDGNFERADEVFYHIVIAEDDLKKVEAEKLHQKRKRQRLTLLKLRGVSMQLHVVTSSIKYIANRIKDTASGPVSRSNSSKDLNYFNTGSSAGGLTPKSGGVTPKVISKDHYGPRPSPLFEPISELRELKQPSANRKTWGGMTPHALEEAVEMGRGGAGGGAQITSNDRLDAIISDDGFGDSPFSSFDAVAKEGAPKQGKSAAVDSDRAAGQSASPKWSPLQGSRDSSGEAAPAPSLSSEKIWGRPDKSPHSGGTLTPSGSPQSNAMSNLSERLNTIISEEFLGDSSGGGSLPKDAMASFRAYDSDISVGGGSHEAAPESFGWIHALSPPGSFTSTAISDGNDCGRVAAWMGI